MFDPSHAGVAGAFYCIGGALFVPLNMERNVRQVMPYVQGLAAKCGKDLKFPYIMGEYDGTPCIGVPHAQEVTVASEKARELGIEDMPPILPASTINDPDKLSTSMQGLLFSGVYKIYSHLCTLSYLYYHANYSVVKDEYYDQLWRAFAHRFEQEPELLDNHPHRKLLEYADVEGGSFHRVPKWPVWIVNAAEIYTAGRRRYVS